MTKAYRKAIMTRSKLRNKYKKNRTQKIVSKNKETKALRF